MNNRIYKFRVPWSLLFLPEKYLQHACCAIDEFWPIISAVGWKFERGYRIKFVVIWIKVHHWIKIYREKCFKILYLGFMHHYGTLCTRVLCAWTEVETIVISEDGKEYMGVGLRISKHCIVYCSLLVLQAIEIDPRILSHDVLINWPPMTVLLKNLFTVHFLLIF